MERSNAFLHVIYRDRRAEDQHETWTFMVQPLRYQWEEASNLVALTTSRAFSKHNWTGSRWEDGDEDDNSDDEDTTTDNPSKLTPFSRALQQVCGGWDGQRGRWR